MFGRFFDTTHIDSFNAEVLKEVLKALPPGQVSAREAARADKRRQQLDDRIRRMAIDLHQRARLNVYQKAKIGTRLQDALEAAGYPHEFAKSFSYDVAVLVAKSAPARVK